MEFLERKVLESWTDKVFGKKNKSKFGNKPGAPDLETKFIKNTPTKKMEIKTKFLKIIPTKKMEIKKGPRRALLLDLQLLTFIKC